MWVDDQVFVPDWFVADSQLKDAVKNEPAAAGGCRSQHWKVATLRSGEVDTSKVPFWAQSAAAKVVIMYWFSGRLICVARDPGQTPFVYSRTVDRAGRRSPGAANGGTLDRMFGAELAL